MHFPSELNLHGSDRVFGSPYVGYCRIRHLRRKVHIIAPRRINFYRFNGNAGKIFAFAVIVAAVSPVNLINDVDNFYAVKIFHRKRVTPGHRLRPALKLSPVRHAVRYRVRVIYTYIHNRLILRYKRENFIDEVDYFIGRIDHLTDFGYILAAG